MSVVRTGIPTALALSLVIAWAAPRSAPAQQVRGNTQLQKALEDLELKGDWFYNDFPAAREEAKRSGKPLLVVLRCPP